MEQIDFIYNAGETRRFHTFPVLREANIAAHSWHVAMLVYVIAGQDEPGIRLPLLMAALTHDAAEWKVGDIPAPAKRSMEDRLQLKGAQTFRAAWGDMEQDILKEVGLDFEEMLTAEEMALLQFCDSLEGALYCVRERSLGNQQIVLCWVNFSKYIENLLDSVEQWPLAAEVWSYAKTQWEIYNGRE